MIRMAFLIADMANDRMKRILLGMSAAAKDHDVRICVFPGRYLVSTGHKKSELPDHYQEAAVFDYIDKKNTDVIVADIKEIGKHALSIKKEAFLSRFAEIPLLVLTETEGYPHVRNTQGSAYELLGKHAVEDAVTFYNKGKLADQERTETELHAPGVSQTQAMEALEAAAHHLTHANYMAQANPYDAVISETLCFGARCAGLFLFPEAREHTTASPWELPEEMLLLSRVRKGKIQHLKEAKTVKSKDIIQSVTGKEGKGPEDNAEEPQIFVMNSIYLDQRQVGLLVLELSGALCVPQVNALFMHLVCGAVRLIANERQIVHTQEELSKQTRELDKETSVLDRLGDEDYLTKQLNRRGFFATAYDFLQKNFKEGTHAIVGYIDMDSIKSINQFFGREEGDHAVKRVSEILTGVFGPGAVLGRIRGNEFAALVVTEDPARADELKDEMAAQNMRLMNDASKPYTIHLQFSICAFRYKKGLSLKQMLAESDENLQKIRQI
ncbi:MAG: GGDEF domain-containing protein [Lachnospiraceae bacterium]|nr:GGDEF domain-containing protein [Lachnospiraceae bacterium]